MRQRCTGELPRQEEIIRRWLRLHLCALWCLVGAALAVELAMAVVTHRADGFAPRGMGEYLVKYVVAPSGMNLALALAATALARTRHGPPALGWYAVSLALTGVNLVLYTIHSIFPAVAALFLVGVLLTTTYGDYALTTATALFSLASMTVSGLFWSWDASKRPVTGSTIETVDFLIQLLILLGVYLLCLAVIYFERRKNAAIVCAEQERLRLWEAARNDSLTGLHNRTALREALDQVEARRETVSFVMIDLDHFKALNDTHGHVQGDACLQHMASILRKTAGEQPVFRYGGDEFCTLLWGCGGEEAAAFCRRVGREMERSGLCVRYGVEASFGVAEYTPGLSAHQLLERADEALYRAKAMRNAVCVWEEQRP